MGKRAPKANNPEAAAAAATSKDDDGELELSPEMAPVDSEEDNDDDSVYDSEDGLHYSDEEEEERDDDNEDDEDNDEFEDQGSSDDEEDILERQGEDESEDEDIALSYETQPRSWQKKASGTKRSSRGTATASSDVENTDNTEGKAAVISEYVHTDDLSSDDDDEEGQGNRIGRVPLHWYDEYEHIGYDAHGTKVIKSASAITGGADRIDQALALQDQRAQGKFVVHDALNDRNVELSARQLELIRRVQKGAYAHPEHEAYPEYSDYYSGVDPMISGLNSNQDPPKARFQPSKWDKMQVDRLLEKLRKGDINMDYLTGKIRDMNDVHKKNPNEPFELWQGDEEDLLNMRKGPQHIAAPKLPPPGHAASYIPPDEYLPTEQELEQWKYLPSKDRPHGHMIPQKFPNLRSVGAYQHSVREAFERCLDLYLCPRILKRRLNIDPESLVPRLPQAQDLKPFPNVKCLEYVTPYDEKNVSPPLIRCVTPSPDGQYLASGASDGYVRLWEVETGRLLRSWDVSRMVKDVCAGSATDDQQGSNADDVGTASSASKIPVVSLEWNPNQSHHCLLAAVGSCAVVIATGTAGANDAELTQALLVAAAQGGSVNRASRAAKAVQWLSLVQKDNNDNDQDKIASESIMASSSPISSVDASVGPICALRTNKEVASVRWQAKGDYFVSISPKAGAAAVLIHQLSKGNSQQPFSKAKGETQLACFHPNKPFLFVASQQHVRIYHLVQQTMVKRLVSGCRWISSLDVHHTGDHLILGSLDHRVVWFDLDLSATPYKKLKYHTRAVRSCRFHPRYPLMCSASDDGSVHVFHGRVYSDLMRNPLVVPVKKLEGQHAVTNKLGVLTAAFHPTQPWLFTGGADGKIFLYQDI